jgi:predicted PurR-regulated permease PerM
VSGIPLSAILASCGVVVLIYLAGKIAYRMLDVLPMIAVAGFLAVILNPLVGYVQRRVRRRVGERVRHWHRRRPLPRVAAGGAHAADSG